MLTGELRSKIDNVWNPICSMSRRSRGSHLRQDSRDQRERGRLIPTVPDNDSLFSSWPDLFRPSTSESGLRVKSNFLRSFNAILPVQSSRKNISLVASGKSALRLPPSCPLAEGRYGQSSRNAGQGAMDAGIAARDERSERGRRSRVVLASRR